MALVIDAIYRDGAFHPLQPVDLPNGTPVRLRVVRVAAESDEEDDDLRDFDDPQDGEDR